MAEPVGESAKEGFLVGVENADLDGDYDSEREEHEGEDEIGVVAVEISGEVVVCEVLWDAGSVGPEICGSETGEDFRGEKVRLFLKQW